MVLILRNLLVKPYRFNELKRSIPGISQKVLTDNLRTMENEKIISRTVFTVLPQKVEYKLTEIGESMRPIIKEMEIWGNYYKSIY